MQRFKNPKYVALAGSLLSAAQFLYVLSSMPETLDIDKRKPIEWSACSPFNFLRFYTMWQIDINAIFFNAFETPVESGAHNF